MRRKTNPAKLLFQGKDKPKVKKKKLPSLAKLRRTADKLLQVKYVGLNPNCIVCGRTTSEMHHVIPKSQSSFLRYDPENLVPLCRGCHFRHHNTSDPAIMVVILYKQKAGWFDYLENNRHVLVKTNRAFYEDKIKDLSR